MKTSTEAIVATSLEQGGGTFRNTGEAVTSGIAVGMRTLYTGPALDEMQVEFATVVAEIIGTWYDEENDRWEVQETAVFEDREAALFVARSRGERYVYDIDADECIAVPSMSTEGN